MQLLVEPHPLLDWGAFVSDFSSPLGEMSLPSEMQSLLALSASTPFQSDDLVREKVRLMLRKGGFRPTGRSKPASEYLLKAVADKALNAINPAVDVCNIVSLHSGLPISVVDVDLLELPIHVGDASAGMSYVFNASGQVIDLEGLLCLWDARGPCANAVKDAQRTKTHAQTRRTLSLIWGTRDLPGRTLRVVEWYRQLVESIGAKTTAVDGVDLS